MELPCGHIYAWPFRHRLRIPHPQHRQKLGPRNPRVCSIQTYIELLEQRRLLSGGQFLTLAPPLPPNTPPYSRALDVSGNLIVGQSGATQPLDPTSAAFLYNETTQEYTTLDGNVASAVSGANVLVNPIVPENSSGYYPALLYNASTGAYRDIAPPGTVTSHASAIDTSNVVGVYSTTSSGQAFVYNTAINSYTTINVPGATFTEPEAICGDNVVGQFGTPSDPSVRSFVYNIANQSYRTIAPPGSDYTFADAIDGNNIVGRFITRSGTSYGFLYNGLTYITLTPPGAANVIDSLDIDGNIIVGNYVTPAMEHRGFIYNIQTRSYSTIIPPDTQSGSTYAVYVSAISGNTVVGGYATEATIGLQAFLYRIPSVNVSPSVKVAAAGDSIAYTIDVTPPPQAQSIEVLDAVPTGTLLVPFSVTNGGVVTVDANGQSTITWDLPSGSSSVISFTVTVNNDGQSPLPASITDTATATTTVGGQKQTDSASATVALVQGQFDWRMAPRYGVDINGDPTTIDKTVLQNVASYVKPIDGYTLDLDASSIVAPLVIEKWTWTIVNANQPTATPVTADGETTTKKLKQGEYNVTLTLILSDGTTVPINQQVTVRDILIVDMGESYASGEGNPDVTITNAGGSADGALKAYADQMWAQSMSPDMTLDTSTTGMTNENAEAHRSTYAGSSQAAYNIQQADPHISVTYVMVAISGAKMLDGMFGPKMNGNEHTDKPVGSLGEIDELAAILNGRHPDIIYMSMGGDDAPGTIADPLTGVPQPTGLGDLIADFLEEASKVNNDPAQIEAWERNTVQPAITEGLSELKSNFAKLASTLQQRFSPNYVIQSDYPNPTEGDNGTPIAIGQDIAGHKLEITQQMSQWLTGHLIDPLNTLIPGSVASIATQDPNTTVQPNGWQLAEVGDNASAPGPFSDHGYGAAVPYFVTATQARQNEGYQSTIYDKVFGVWPVVRVSDGAAHPNSLGQQVYADVLQPMMQNDINALLALSNLGLHNQPGNSGSSVIATTAPAKPLQTAAAQSDRPARGDDATANQHHRRRWLWAGGDRGERGWKREYVVQWRSLSGQLQQHAQRNGYGYGDQWRGDVLRTYD